MQYDRHHPFMASIKERYHLSKPGSQKETIHVVLDIKDSGMNYTAGDSIAVFPTNEPSLVERTLKALKATGHEKIQDKKGNPFTLKEYLTEHANLKGISKKTIAKLASRVSDDFKLPLERLLEEGHKEELKEWIHSHELWDLIERHPEAHFTPEEVVDLVMPLLPRFYSIASSQKTNNNEVHLTIAYLRYETRGISRIGVCTHFLCQAASLHETKIPVYIQSSRDFRIPDDPDKNIIMVGPGTGVAPFRAFMQEREARKDCGKNWLFFGEWTHAHEFLYEEDWKRWEALGLLKLDTAFSRDQPHKIYVQHLLEKHGHEVYEWLEKGASFYVCGDAHKMAKDVEASLLKIIEIHGQKTALEASGYLKRLRLESRYLRDVY